MTRSKRSRNKKKKSRSAPGPPSTRVARPGTRRTKSADVSDSGPATPEEVRRLLDSGHVKPALAKAKQIYKSSPSPETEEILIRAYIARIESFEAGMGAEAKAMMDLVAARHPSAKHRLAEIRPRVEARTGKPARLLRPLADSGTSPEERLRIENIISSELTELETLARSSALPKIHPLRKAADAASQAFSAVTRGPADHNDLLLPEISRRSSLGPWKPLIRAIACFHRKDDTRCAELLEAVEPSSAPGRLVAPLREMMANRVQSKSAPELARRIRGEAVPLRGALKKLDRALAKKNPDQILAAVRESLRECRRLRPELVEQLEQQISTRCFLTDLPASAVRAALGGPTRHDAHFWRLMALALESEHDAPMACSLWEEFRRNAIHEGWFPEGGPEEAAVYLYMVGLLLRMSAEDLDHAREHFEIHFGGYEDYYQQRPRAVRAVRPKPGRHDTFFLYPHELFQRAVRCDPRPETFRQWLAWAKETRAADETALAWHEACPADSEPLLHLMESCEKRNALRKALRYLEQAEALDGLNPEVKRARIRLVVANAIRHFSNRNFRLADKDITELEALPQMEMGDRPAFVAALRWLWHAMQEAGQAPSFLEEAGRLLESDLAGYLILEGLATVCDPSGIQAKNLKLPSLRGSCDLAGELARGCALCEDLRLPIIIPLPWRARLLSDLAAGKSTPDPHSLRRIAEAALRLLDRELAFALSGRGLELGGPHSARFLLLRARSLPPWETERISDCLEASSVLARRVRDMDLVHDIVDAGQFVFGPGSGLGLEANAADPNGAPTSQKWIDQVLGRERQERELPEPPVDELEPDELCQCPACRRNRRSSASAPESRQFDLFDEFFADDDEETENDFEGIDAFEGPMDGEEYLGDFEELNNFDPLADDLPLPPEFANMSPELMAVMAEIITRYGNRKGEVPDVEELRKLSPKLFSRLEEAFLRQEVGRELDAPFEPPRKRRSPRKQKKSKRRKRR